MSGTAASVLDALRFAAEQRGVRMLCEKQVTAIAPKGERWQVTAGDAAFTADALILAAGGSAAPNCGTDGNLLPLLKKIPARAGLMSSTVLLFIFRNINDGNLGFENIILYRLPDFLYEHGMPGTFLGLQDKNFSSADYFSFIPWYFLFIKGYFICRVILKHRAAKGLTGLPDVFHKGIPVLETLGQHSLLVYMLHQPVILLILSFILKPAM